MWHEEVENRMVVDSQWPEPEELEPGYFSRYGNFVKEEYLLEVAMQEIYKGSIIKDDFLEKVLNYIEGDKDATTKFLKWFYPDYREEQ